MVSNSLFIRRGIAIFFLFSVLPFLYAQDENYFFDTSGASPRFFQRLSWTGNEYAIDYEVIIQRRERGGEYTEVLRERTEELLINVSLAAGDYRYRVIPLNLLGQSDEGPEWRAFEVKAAYIPSIVKFNPVVFFLDRYGVKEMEIIGNNLLEESEIYLQKTTGLIIYPIEKTVISKERVKLTFDDLKLVSGEYEIHVKNPGVPEITTGGFSISYRKPLDIFLKISWIPVVPVYGETEIFMDKKFSSAGAGLSFEVISSARSSFNGGLELAVSVFSMDAISTFKDFSDGGNGDFCTEFDLNFAFQKQFMYKKMSLTVRLGVGGTMNNGGLVNDDDILFHFNFGLSYSYFIYKSFFAEAGVTFSYYYAQDSFGLLRPRLSVGWIF